MRYSNPETTITKEINFVVTIKEDKGEVKYEVDRVDDLMELLFLIDKKPSDIVDIKLHTLVKRK